MGLLLRQFGLLLWKNYSLQKRQIILTLFEIGLPALFSFILIFIRQIVASTLIAEPTVYSAFQYNLISDKLTPPSATGVQDVHRYIDLYATRGVHVTLRDAFYPWNVAYTPKGVPFDNIMQATVDNLLQNTTKNVPYGFATESEMVTFLLTGNKTAQRILAGVVFLNEFPMNVTTSADITYKLRFPSFPRNAPASTHFR